MNKKLFREFEEFLAKTEHKSDWYSEAPSTTPKETAPTNALKPEGKPAVDPFDKKLRCFWYSVNTGSHELASGWHPALSQLEAIKQLMSKYKIEISEIVDLKDEGSWEAFLDHGNSFGWD